MKKNLKRVLIVLSLLLLATLTASIKPNITVKSDTVSSLDEAKSSQIKHILRKNDFDGSILVVKDGKPVFSSTNGYADYALKQKNDETTAFEIDSIQKNFTAGILMKLVEHHKVKLTDKLSKFFPEVPGSNKIALRNMLDMTSGLTMSGEGPHFVESDAGIAQFDARSVSFSRVMLNHWQYSPVNFMLLARIEEMITNKPYRQLFTEAYIQPLKLQHTTFAYVSPTDVTKAQGYTNENPLSGSLDYRNPYVTQQFEAHDELGTGQVFMSPMDLYRAERYLVSGDYLSDKSRQELYIQGSPSTYGGGFYNHSQSHSANGWGYGFQSVVHISDNGQTAVITMSNYQRISRDTKPLSAQIYNLVHNQ